MRSTKIFNKLKKGLKLKNKIEFANKLIYKYIFVSQTELTRVLQSTNKCYLN